MLLAPVAGARQLMAAVGSLQVVGLLWSAKSALLLAGVLLWPAFAAEKARVSTTALVDCRHSAGRGRGFTCFLHTCAVES